MANQFQSLVDAVTLEVMWMQWDMGSREQMVWKLRYLLKQGHIV